MRRALALARRAEGRTAPNPMVGAILVDSGGVAGRGWHQRAGEPHAEVLALRDAGPRARGATLYVTLEPCCHQGRTPPCTDALIDAGVSRVVAAMADPNPLVAGKGFQRLREAGLRVECGLLEAEARALNRGYVRAISSGLPWVALKMAMTLDGRIATPGGDSRWITGEKARRQVHRLRDRCDALLVGRGTALADDPLLTTRLPRGRSPLRVIACGSGLISPASRLAASARQSPLLLLHRSGLNPDPDEVRELEAAGVELQEVAAGESGPDEIAMLRALRDRGCCSVLCEGGARLAGRLFDRNLIDEVYWFIAPRLAGAGPGPLSSAGVTKMDEAKQLLHPRVRQFGPDLLCHGFLRDPHL